MSIILTHSLESASHRWQQSRRVFMYMGPWRMRHKCMATAIKAGVSAVTSGGLQRCIGTRVRASANKETNAVGGILYGDDYLLWPGTNWLQGRAGPTTPSRLQWQDCRTHAAGWTLVLPLWCGGQWAAVLAPAAASGGLRLHNSRREGPFSADTLCPSSDDDRRACAGSCMSHRA